MPWYKPKRNKTTLVPDYYLHKTESWLKYPRSVEGLSRDEIAAHRPEILEIIGDLVPPVEGAEVGDDSAAGAEPNA